MARRAADWEAGLDAKWTPNANTAIDATINPDFSQVESDVAQITANQRFALFFPEKRPFFLEGLELFSTPHPGGLHPHHHLAALGTARHGRGRQRPATPSWSPRTAAAAASSCPAPTGSDLADQDFSSRVAIGRGRKDFGNSFASFLLTDREIEGGGHNRVLGPDFQWRPNGDDTVTGQFLVSDSQTPDRPGPRRGVERPGASAPTPPLSKWSHSTRTWDWNLQYLDIGDEFRADLGFLPQVGVRDSTAFVGRSVYVDKGPFRRIHPYFQIRNVDDTGGGLLLRRYVPGVELEGFWNSYFGVERRTETRCGPGTGSSIPATIRSSRR